jgi:hypothetical protein
MRNAYVVLVGIVLAFALHLTSADAQLAGVLQRSATSAGLTVSSADDLEAMLEAAEAVEPLSAESVPARATFYSAQNPAWPPLPGNINGVSVWNLGSNVWLLNDLELGYAVQSRSQALTMNLVPPGPGSGGEGGTNGYQSGFSPQVFTTNDLWLEFAGITNATASLIIHPPWNVTNGVYDLFSTTNLVPSAWTWVLRCSSGQTNLIVTNLTAPMDFFILGLTNDTDGGGLSDAYEGLVTHTDPNNPNDDHLVPLVGIYVTDSVAVEQETNTAQFVVTRLGGRMNQPLTVGCQVSGTATLGTDYTLSSVTTMPSNVVLVTIPAWHTNVQITLSARNDTNVEGSETATLTLTTNSAWEVDAAHESATAWILEEYSKTYTSNADFALGVMDGLEAVNNCLEFKTNLPPQFPFINVACSHRGTLARINTTNGMVVGEYQTAPEDMISTGDVGGDTGPSPSRTAVDQYGNVWVANRNDDLSIDGVKKGSITRIGLIVGGTRHSKTNGVVYVPDPQGQYVSLSNATYNTCIDRDGDGYIRTSRGLGDILPWSDERDGVFGVDLEGGVSTAEDEAITEYTRVPCTGTRTIAVDKFNDLWVGGYRDNRTHLKVNGLLGLPVPNSAFDAYNGGYGGVIDALGNLWSSSGSGVVWLKPPAVLPPTNGDWRVLTPSSVSPYGIAVDPAHPYVWQTFGGVVFRWDIYDTNGTPVTNVDGSVQTNYHGYDNSKGLVVATNGHVWVAQYGSHTVGHLDTNGVWLGNVDLRINGLWAEYFANTNLDGFPVLARLEGPVDFSWTNGWPDSPVPTNSFSARWSGVVQPQVQGDHVFYVSADAGAAFRLKVNGTIIIDNWTSPATNAVELAGTNWLGTNVAYDVKLEYAHFTDGARVKLSWTEPGMTNEEVIPLNRFVKSATDTNPTGVSVDAAGKIWAANQSTSNAMRIDPNAGQMVVTNGVTNHVGLVDMVVDLGSGANPYDYSDMTGLNNRVVNPGLEPLRGYWTVIHDCGIVGEVWNRVSWNATLTNGCSVEVYVRASDDRQALANEAFVPATNDVMLTGATVNGVRGRFIEVRLAMTRDDANKKPVLDDLTLYGTSSGFNSDAFLDDASAAEGDNAMFSPNLIGAEPVTYQWFIQYPWMTNWLWLPTETNSSLVITNVDSFVDWTLVSVLLTNATGESLWLGPASLEVIPLSMRIPASSYSSGPGPAERYPATINVFGQPTNLASMKVTLFDLSHGHSADLDILLVSPSGTNIMLMSHVGGTNGVSGATLIFEQGQSLPPTSSPIPSAWTSRYEPSNYGNITNMPGAPSGPYSTSLYDLIGDNPNGTWKLYIYDDHQAGIGSLSGSWRLDFTF